MAERPIIDQLDDAVTALLAGREADSAAIDVSLLELVEVARQLRGLPRGEFKRQLKDELIRSDEMSSPQMKIEPKAPTLSFHLCFNDAAAAIEFYKEAFGAEELMRLTEPSGKMGHAEIKIGDALIMMADEYPDYGVLSPQTLGGSPVRLHLSVPDVDAFVEKVVTLGATIVRPVADQFYGDRTGTIVDPFGYTWTIATRQRDVSIEEMQSQLNESSKQQTEKETTPAGERTFIREGFHTVTPYLTVEQPAELLEFIKQSFLATELGRTTGSAGGMHAEARIGDSMLMVGGGVGLGKHPTAIHLYVPDVDEAYARALKAGATSLMEPADQEYGERSGGVQDPTGNRWYIATPFVPLKEISEYLRTVTLYLHPIGAQGMIEFLEKGLGGQELMRHASPEGYIYHAKVRIGDSAIELGEARTEDQPMPSAIYLYVEDVDALYEQALKAGGESVLPPTDQPYGDRNAWVKDPFGNVWYLATHLA
jgi:PhnB protein